MKNLRIMVAEFILCPWISPTLSRLSMKSEPRTKGNCPPNRPFDRSDFVETLDDIGAQDTRDEGFRRMT